MSRTVGDLLAECLVARGVTRVWGEGGPWSDNATLDVVAIDDPAMSVLLADADGRIRRGLGAAMVPGEVLHLSSKPGGLATPQTIRSPEELVEALAVAPGDLVPATSAVHLDLALDEPVANDLIPRTDPTPGIVYTLNPSFADARVVVVVGPGVVRGGYVGGLAELAVRTGWGVLNTWGAKGVFPWFDARHFGTVGLQRDDFVLAGVSDADLVIASGLDLDESPLSVLGSTMVQEVEPWQLAALTYHWDATREPPAEKPALYREISEIVTPMYENASVPLSGPRAALHLSGSRPAGGLVVADAGLSGFWIARTFPTREPESVLVPATSEPGFAAAAGLVCAIDGRPCVAVLDGVLDDTSAAVLEVAGVFGLDVAVQVWGEHSANGSSMPSSADEHARMTEAQFAGAPTIIDVPIAANLERRLIDVAGPITAWEGAIDQAGDRVGDRET